MPIDKVKFNAIYNQLKELVGDRGAFAIMVTRQGDGLSEDMKFETHGPLTTLNGMLAIGTQYLSEAMQQRLDGLMKPGPRQPD
jgi:hypothetical protein